MHCRTKTVICRPDPGVDTFKQSCGPSYCNSARPRLRCPLAVVDKAKVSIHPATGITPLGQCVGFCSRRFNWAQSVARWFEVTDMQNPGGVSPRFLERGFAQPRSGDTMRNHMFETLPEDEFHG